MNVPLPFLVILIGLNYLLLLALFITGLLKLVQKDNPTLRAAHRWAAIPAIVTWILVHITAHLAIHDPNELRIKVLISFLLFLVLVFGGALTGWRSKPGARRALHMVLGALTFLLFTAFLFRVILLAA